MQCGNQWLYPLSGAAIINDVVCSGQALLTRDLCGQYVLCLLTADTVAGDGSGQLSLAVDVNHQHAIGARLPKTYEFSSFVEVFAHAKQLPQNEEGYVVLFANGMRVKVKGTAYVNLNSGIWGVSEKTILEALKTGGQEAYLKLVAMVPEEMRALADQIVAEYTAEIAALQEQTHALLAKAPPKDPRKAFAAWVYANVQPSLRGAIFALADGKSLNWFDLARSQH